MDAMKDREIILLMVAALCACWAVVATLLGKTEIFSLGRVNMQNKKYRFHQIISETAANGLILSPIVLAETNRFRDVEGLRDSIPCNKVAIVYEPEAQRSVNAA